MFGKLLEKLNAKRNHEKAEKFMKEELEKKGFVTSEELEEKGLELNSEIGRENIDRTREEYLRKLKERKMKERGK